MELRHLRYFVAAAEEEHFARASDRLHVSRPAVSQIISDLESELGTPLFERLAHGVRLTAAGHAFLPQVRATLSTLSDAITVARRVGQGRSGELNIGYGSLTLLHPVFRATVKAFHEACPEITLSLLEIPTGDQPRALADGKIHAGFMHIGPKPVPQRRMRADGVLAQDETVLDWTCIQTGTLGVIVPRDHPFASRKSVGLDELAKERFVAVPRSCSSPCFGHLHGLCQKAGFDPLIVQEVSSTASQLNLISAGIGIGLAPTDTGFRYPDTTAIVALENIDYPISFVFGWMEGRRNPALDRMIAIAESLAVAP